MLGRIFILFSYSIFHLANDAVDAVIFFPWFRLIGIPDCWLHIHWMLQPYCHCRFFFSRSTIANCLCTQSFSLLHKDFCIAFDFLPVGTITAIVRESKCKSILSNKGCDKLELRYNTEKILYSKAKRKFPAKLLALIMRWDCVYIEISNICTPFKVFI